MKSWLLFFLLLIPLLAAAEGALPPPPRSRVSDLDALFDPKTREYLSQKLNAEYAHHKISVYIVALSESKRGQETTIANQLRDAWIKDRVGFIVLFTSNSDKISISLTDGAYRLIAARGRLEPLASKIDEFNEEGPTRGMPQVINLLLERIRPDRQQIVVVQEHDVPIWLIMGPFYILLALLGWGMFRVFCYMETQNVFTPRYVLKSEPVKVVLGSTIGGVNTAEGKF